MTTNTDTTAAQEAEPAVPVEPTDEMYVAAGAVELPTGDDDGGSIHLNTSQVRQIWQAMRAALYTHPTRPQADAGAVRLPDPEAPEVSAAIDKILAGYVWPSTAKAYAYAGFQAARHLLAAAPQAPAAPTAAEAEQDPARAAGALEKAWRAGWAACRDAEYVGEEAEDWAWGASAINGIAIDIEQAPAAGAAPTDAEIADVSLEYVRVEPLSDFDYVAFARAALARWGARARQEGGAA